MKINREAIARAALTLLNETGLEGLTMRLLAKSLNVQAPALYWHIKNKQELLDAMATIISVVATESLPLDTISPEKGTPFWQTWLHTWAQALRTTLLTYRDGARVVAGTYVTHPAITTHLETTLRILEDAGFPPDKSAQALSLVLHYTIGHTIEEQARQGHPYPPDQNPYATPTSPTTPTRHPRTTQALNYLSTTDPTDQFDQSLNTILTGLKSTLPT
ncbi:TetR/AcrR family transcriptional regulator C-terminal domain-containing protein [Sphaerisporangium rubeum]|uniref:TetR/AcrR family tetracycline transcriptional repressor n=1 Tax=Sphaerisporangium rubeum TaxID=321317 RepID=A0A7X0IAQ0_9ACTN|nr:TetR/AcrR family transcriptional regulator C-terminal domain-containing protein [Sphaerisporangium rubeum]MBB6471595.1 TetR/AcrR family tetracycline transcriptional repressor [Sphaerisporangium rubeum]